jgi:hypothetical protein
MARITHEQLKQWADNPVTEVLLDHIADYLKDLESASGLNCYVAYEPNRTQENLSQLAGQQTAWGEITEVLSGDWMIFSSGEDSDDEYFRYLSEGEPDRSEAG